MKVRAQWDSTNEIIFERDLKDNETLDGDIYAEIVADMFDTGLSKDTGYVQLGCGDFSITLADNPDSVVCWQSKSYFLGD